jgi:hypothetical protein
VRRVATTLGLRAIAAASIVAFCAPSCSAPDEPPPAPPERVGDAEEPMHATHAGPPPWKHVLTCYGGCDPPHYDASACNHHTSCGPVANGKWWYSTERVAFHCGAKLKLERGGKCVVVDVEDNGPADWVESNADSKCGTPYIIDASPLVHDYFGGGCGWGECFLVDVSPVPDDTPPGPDGCNQCECKAGETQSEGCGNCGTRHRTCGGDCHWGGWSGCEGQGECQKGDVETVACCDCGTQHRTCDDSCHWQGYSECAGPDPDDGEAACATGQPGICASGHVRCVKGCRTCARDAEPRPETCDDVDEDCDGVADDGDPQAMGDPLPRFAARLDDASRPGALAPGETGEGWATFTNVGREAWPARSVWLASAAARGGLASPLRADEWPAWDVAAVVEESVPAGGAVRVAFAIRAPADDREAARDELVLETPEGAPMRCPSPSIAIDLAVDTPLDVARPAPAALAASGGCGVARHAGGHGEAAIALLALAAWRRRRRAAR